LIGFRFFDVSVLETMFSSSGLKCDPKFTQKANGCRGAAINLQGKSFAGWLTEDKKDLALLGQA
jgi:hypothetical protein